MVIVVGSSRGSHFVGFALLLAVVAAVMLVSFVGPWIALVVLVIAGAAMVLLFRRSVMAAFGWHAPELVLPAASLQLGSNVAVVYRRRPRAIRDLPRAKANFTVVCEERATYQRGTDTVTDVSKVVEQRFSAEGEGKPNGFEVATILPIPYNAGAPTMDLGDNEIRWYILATLQGPGLPKDERRFDIQVGPTLDPALGNELGDT